MTSQQTDYYADDDLASLHIHTNTTAVTATTTTAFNYQYKQAFLICFNHTDDAARKKKRAESQKGLFSLKNLVMNTFLFLSDNSFWPVLFSRSVVSQCKSTLMMRIGGMREVKRNVGSTTEEVPSTYSALESIRTFLIFANCYMPLHKLFFDNLYSAYSKEMSRLTSLYTRISIAEATISHLPYSFSRSHTILSVCRSLAHHHGRQPLE